jgi:hypothetical protein
MEFPLSKAPELFFDKQLWQIFVSYLGAPEMALERIVVESTRMSPIGT